MRPSQSKTDTIHGWVKPASAQTTELSAALGLLRHPAFVFMKDNSVCAVTDPEDIMFGEQPDMDWLPLAGIIPPCLPENLGDRSFCDELGLGYPYLGGSMAKGISSVAMARSLGEAGMLGCFGAAGLPLATVESAVVQLLEFNFPFACNLIHSPHEPDLEQALAELYIRKGVRLIEASAFLNLTLPLVRYRLHGIHRAADGSIATPNRIIAKVSREELAERFFSPPPEKLLKVLLAEGTITELQAELAGQIPMAQEVTAEADSGGHTDNRPSLALFPTIKSLAARMQQKYGYTVKLRVGLGGGIGTPASAAAAFVMGADYIMTGSVNQACIESGTSDAVRAMLAETRQADVIMAPAADMFEMGVNVQVLKRGTMFPMRAQKLYELYRSCASLEEIPVAEREKLEKTFFLAPLEQIWQQTRSFFLQRDPGQVERAEREPKHRMALVFRWYLGQAAHWAKDGVPNRAIDYQVWCGPAMGAFNEWVAGSFMEEPARRDVATVAFNILFGAAMLIRANSLCTQGVAMPDESLTIEPIEINNIKEYLR